MGRILYAFSFILMMCGMAQALAGCVDVLYGAAVLEDVFFLSGSVTISLGLVLYFLTRTTTRPMRAKEMFVITGGAWILFSLFAALPFYYGANLSLTDAIFESVSGLTTTGSSIFADVEALSAGMLFFRSLLQWIGGAGIIVVALLVLPVLSMGGMHFLATESSEQSDKIRPKISHNMREIFAAFLVLTGLCCGCLYMAGMSFFDAVNHAMTCIATGGFSTHNNSVAYFHSPAIEWILTVFMFIAGFPLLMWALLRKGKFKMVAENRQIFLYIKFTLFIIAFTVLWRMGFLFFDHPAAADIIRDTSFNIVSVMTSTGFVNQDFTLWGPVAVPLFVFLMMTGGCTGSTSGGIKMFRYNIMFGMMKARFLSLLEPFGVFVPRYGDRPLSDKMIAGVLVFISLFFFVLIVGVFALALTGLDFITAFTSVLSAVSNVGPAMGSVSPTGTFDALPDSAKLILSGIMLLGRLEFVSVIILFTPFFWKKNV